MNGTFTSGGLQLARYLARPAGRVDALPGLILCHGFPIGPLDARQSAGTFPELIDRIANEHGWAAMTFTFRGCGTSEGDFSLQGWVDDLRARSTTSSPRRTRWASGSSAPTPAGRSPPASPPTTRASAVPALLSPRADFDDWAAQPRRFLEHAREIGAIRTPGSRGRSTSGPASCAGSARSTPPAGSRPDRCW